MKKTLLTILQTIRNFMYNDSFKYYLLWFYLLCIIIYRFFSGLKFDISIFILMISILILFIIYYFVLYLFNYNKYFKSILIFIFRCIYTIIGIFLYFSLFFVSQEIKLLSDSLFTTIYCSSGEEDKIIKDVLKVTSEIDNTNKEYYNFKLSKKMVDNSINNVVEGSNLALDKLVPNLGVGAATGAATAQFAMIKSTNGMPIVQRLIVLGSTAATTAVGTKIGFNLGTAISKNVDINTMIKNSAHANPQPDRIPSPDPNIIPSPLETNNEMTSPLQDLLLYSFSLDIIILILFIIILIIIFNRYILKFNINFINFLLNKFMPIKIINWFNKYFNLSIDYQSKFILLIFIINSIFIVIFILLKIIISSELLINIDSYINVHNYIHSK